MLSDKILKTKHLVIDKSEFLIDLKESSSGKRYLEITKTIEKGEKSISASIKINPKILNFLVASLLEFDGQKERAASIPKDRYGQDIEKKKSAYLKGSTLDSLQLQFPRYSVEEMEVMLRGAGVVIANQTYSPPKKRHYYKKRK